MKPSICGEHDGLIVEGFTELAFGENAYLLYPAGDGPRPCWVVDPGFFPQPGWMVKRIARLGLQPQAVLLTHGHCDHLIGTAKVRDRWPDCRIHIADADAGGLTDPAVNLSAQFGVPVSPGVEPTDPLEPGERLSLGPLAWHVLDTSGHSPGGRSLHCPSAQVVLTGDALFAGSIGRTDLPGMSTEQLLGNIRAHLLTLPGATAVYPGHGEPTTIAAEARANPFLSHDGD